MFNSNNDGFTMPVVPMGGYGNGGDGLFGGNGIWAILLIVLLFGGWGGGFGGFGGGYGMGMGSMIYPWMNQAEVTQNGFRDQMLNTSINTIGNNVTSGFGDVQTALCGGFAGVNATVNGAQNALSQQMYTNQIADMERSYASQTASMQGMNAIQGQLAQCCCDNRLATCQTQNIVQNEGNSTRFADANNTRDIITNATANTQAILDKLCQLELDGVKREVDAKNDRIAELQTQLNMASMRNAVNDETDLLYNRLKSCPIPSQPVYGNTPIFTCNSQNPTGCGCGCGNGF